MGVFSVSNGSLKYKSKSALISSINGSKIKSADENQVISVIRYVDLAEKKSLHRQINRLKTVNALKKKVMVLCRKRGIPFINWKLVDNYFDFIQNKTSLLLKKVSRHKFRYYFTDYNVKVGHQHGIHDLVNAAVILAQTVKERIICKCKGKDAFYLTALFKKKSKHRKEIYVASDHSSYQNNGHSHILLTLTGFDDASIRLAFDPATHKLGPGYDHQAQFATYKENAHIILISHAHADHFMGIKYLVKDVCYSPLRKIVQCFPFTATFFKYQIRPLKKVNQKVISPKGTEKIVPALKYINKHPACDGRPVGVPAWSFDPLMVCRGNKKNKFKAALTIVPVITKHWAGRIPLIDNHTAPALSYLIKSIDKMVYFTGDTAFDHELYQAVAEISFEMGAPYIDVLFSPAGPDFDRHSMEHSHQATIDILIAHFYLQVLPFITYKSDYFDAIKKYDLIRELCAKTECIFIHHGHYKLGNVHAEDPWICMMDLIHTLHNGEDCYRSRAKYAEKDGSERLVSWLNSKSYRETKDYVLDLIDFFEKKICSLDLNWERKDTIIIALNLLLSQSEPLQTVMLNAGWHQLLSRCIIDTVSSGSFSFSLLNLTHFAHWYFTIPTSRDEKLFYKCFVQRS